MPNTTNWNIFYPDGTEAASVPDAMQNAAQTIEEALDDVTAGIEWTDLTLLNGYGPYTGGGGYYNGLRASKAGNFIHVHGMVMNPTTGDPKTTIAVLPVGLRPMYTLLAPVTTGNATNTRVIGNIAVSSGGGITYETGATDPTFVMINFTIPVN